MVSVLADSKTAIVEYLAKRIADGVVSGEHELFIGDSIATYFVYWLRFLSPYAYFWVMKGHAKNSE